MYKSQQLSLIQRNIRGTNEAHQTSETGNTVTQNCSHTST